MSIDGYKEGRFDLLQLLQDLKHLLIILFLLIVLVRKFPRRILVLLGIFQGFELTVIYVSIHHEALLADIFHGMERTSLASILIHDVLAQPIVPALKLVANDLVHLEVPFDVPVSIQPAPLIVYNDVLGGINVTIAQVDAIVQAGFYDVVIEDAPAASEDDQARPDGTGDVVVDHLDSRFLFHDHVGILVFYDLVVLYENIRLGMEVEPCPLVLVDLVINDLDLLRIGDFNAREVVFPDFVAEYAGIIGHEHIDAGLVAVVNLVFDQSAGGIVADINAAACRAENVVVFCQDACTLTSDHDT